MVAGHPLALIILSWCLDSETPPEAFGQPGQLVLDASFALSLSVASVSGPDASAGRTSYFVAPSASYTVGDNVLLRGEILFIHISTPILKSKTTDVGGAMGGGWNLPVASRTSLLFSAFGQFIWWTTATDGQKRAGYLVSPRFDLALLIHPVAHFFIGFGPHLSFDVISRSAGAAWPRTTRLSLTSTLGGWF
jgi:hypothetical protein